MCFRFVLFLFLVLFSRDGYSQQESILFDNIRIKNNTGRVIIFVENPTFKRVTIKVVNPLGDTIYKKRKGFLEEHVRLDINFYRGDDGYYGIYVNSNCFWFLKSRIVVEGTLIEGFGFLSNN